VAAGCTAGGEHQHRHGSNNSSSCTAVSCRCCYAPLPGGQHMLCGQSTQFPDYSRTPATMGPSQHCSILFDWTSLGLWMVPAPVLNPVNVFGGGHCGSPFVRWWYTCQSASLGPMIFIPMQLATTSPLAPVHAYMPEIRPNRCCFLLPTVDHLSCFRTC
jgi:hypothetical protein